MNIRYGKAFHYPRQIAKQFLSLLYPIVIKIWPLPKVMSIEETIHEIIKNKSSIARFGDSEFLYIIDKLNLPYQKYNENLSHRLKKILANNEDFILVGLPSGYHGLQTQTKESVIFWRSQISWIYPRLKKYLNSNNKYANASMSRLYIEMKDKSKCEELFKLAMKIWENRKIVIIEGEKSRLGVGNGLFSNASSIKRILGPPHNAFFQFDAILENAFQFDSETLFLIALGPTAKPIAFELAKKGYQAIDIGNIDIEYEWFLQGVHEKVKITGKYTSEANGGRLVEDVDDVDYKNQIFAKIL